MRQESRPVRAQICNLLITSRALLPLDHATPQPNNPQPHSFPTLGKTLDPIIGCD